MNRRLSSMCSTRKEDTVEREGGGIMHTVLDIIHTVLYTRKSYEAEFESLTSVCTSLGVSLRKPRRVPRERDAGGCGPRCARWLRNRVRWSACAGWQTTMALPLILSSCICLSTFVSHNNTSYWIRIEVQECKSHAVHSLMQAGLPML